MFSNFIPLFYVLEHQKLQKKRKHLIHLHNPGKLKIDSYQHLHRLRIQGKHFPSYYN